MLSQLGNLIPSNDDGQVYNIDAASLNGWDVGYATEECYLVTYRDSATNELHMYMNERDASDDNGLIIVCDSENRIMSLGTTTALYSLDCKDGELRLWRFNEENILEEYYIPYSSTTRAISLPSLSDINKVLSAVDDLATAGTALYQLTQGDWDGYFETLDQAQIDYAAGELLSGIHPSLGIAYTYLRYSYDYYRWNEARRQRKALYADCYPEITEVVNGSQDDCLVFVDLHNTNTLADYLYDFYNKEESDITRNKVYCGVVVRRMFPPTYHNYTYISSLVCLNDGVDYRENLMFMLPRLGNHNYKITPFLLSSRVFDEANDIREEYILYGDTYEYCPNFPARIKDIKVLGGTNHQNLYDDSSSSILNNVVSFQLEINIAFDDMTGIDDWYVYQKQSDGSYCSLIRKGSFTTVSDRVVAAVYDEYFQDFNTGACNIEIDYSNYIAMGYLNSVGVAIKRKDAETGVSYWEYGESKDYKLVYNKKPSISLTNVVQGETLSMTPDAAGRDMRTLYIYEYEISGALFVDEMFRYLINLAGFDENGGKIPYNYENSSDGNIMDGISDGKSSNGMAFTYWSDPEKCDQSNAYIYFGINCQGRDILSANCIELSGVNRSVKLSTRNLTNEEKVKNKACHQREDEFGSDGIFFLPIDKLNVSSTQN